jgi:hypothetical protein
VNGYRHHRRVVATLVAAALFLTACGGGDDGATSGEAAADASAAEAMETVFDLVQFSPADRKAIAEAIEAEGIAHVWEGSQLIVLAADEARIDFFLDTMIEDDVPDEGGGEGVKNIKLKKLVKKVTQPATKVVNQAGGAITDTANQVGNAVTGGTNDALNAVSKEYRNASGQVVDGLGNVVNMLPTTWPNELGPGALKLVVQEAEKQLNSAMGQLQQQGRTLKNMSAAEAEKAVNTLLGNFPVKSPKLPLGGGVNLEFAPVLTPIAVKIQPSQWASANAMNMQLNLSFMGIRAYQVQFGCLGFPNGWTAAPTFTFNGGCHNPWNLMANADMVAASAKKIANQAGRQLQGLSDQILAVMTSAAKEADNPRLIPPLVLDLPINEFLGWCCTLGFPSSKTAESPDAGKPPKKDGTKDPNKPGEDPGDSAMAAAFGSMSKDAALSFAIPELQGINFSLSPDISPVAIFDERWTRNGQMEFGLQLGFFGIISATVKMGCVTFGTSWSQQPTFTFDGGCEKSWGVEFSAPGYTTSSQRLDKRAGR